MLGVSGFPDRKFAQPLFTGRGNPGCPREATPVVTTSTPAEPPVISFGAPAPFPRPGFPDLRLKVLVADDNADAADTLAGLLLLCGADVRVAYDGLAALAVADGFQPDVGLFDVDMPRMGGCELARRVRAAAGRRPMLLAAITGVSDDNAVSRTTTAGFDLHLTKPADPAALLHTLSDFGWWLQAHSSARDSDSDVD